MEVAEEVARVVVGVLEDGKLDSTIRKIEFCSFLAT
jgi:hypothetical protein